MTATAPMPTYTDCRNCGSADHTSYACPCACHAKRRKARVRIALRCNECRTSWRVSPNAADPVCPKCGGVDWDVW